MSSSLGMLLNSSSRHNDNSTQNNRHILPIPRVLIRNYADRAIRKAKNQFIMITYPVLSNIFAA